MYLLGALDENGRITDLGHEMTKLPIDVPYAKALIASLSMGCDDDILTVNKNETGVFKINRLYRCCHLRIFGPRCREQMRRNMRISKRNKLIGAMKMVIM